MTGLDARDVLLFSYSGVRKLSAYFESHPELPRRAIIQHDGIHAKRAFVDQVL